MRRGPGYDVSKKPTTEEMYKDDYRTYVDVEELTQGLCGGNREGHFKGVTTVVTSSSTLKFLQLKRRRRSL